MRDHAAGELETRIGGVVGGRLVALVVLVPALGNVLGAETAHALHLAKQIIQYVAPVADHIQNDAAAFLRFVVPGGTLRALPIAFEHPLSELAAHREHAAEKA